MISFIKAFLIFLFLCNCLMCYGALISGHYFMALISSVFAFLNFVSYNTLDNEEVAVIKKSGNGKK